MLAATAGTACAAGAGPAGAIGTIGIAGNRGRFTSKWHAQTEEHRASAGSSERREDAGAGDRRNRRAPKGDVGHAEVDGHPDRNHCGTLLRLSRRGARWSVRAARRERGGGQSPTPAFLPVVSECATSYKRKQGAKEKPRSHCWSEPLPPCRGVLPQVCVSLPSATLVRQG